MHDHMIEEIVPKNFILACFAYNKIKLKDAVDFSQSFKKLFPQPNFVLIDTEEIKEVKLEGITRSLTNSRFDFDPAKFFPQLRIKTKTLIDCPKILLFYALSEKDKKQFGDLGYYLCDMNAPNWKGNLEIYARQFEG